MFTNAQVNYGPDGATRLARDLRNVVPGQTLGVLGIVTLLVQVGRDYPWRRPLSLSCWAMFVMTRESCACIRGPPRAARFSWGDPTVPEKLRPRAPRMADLQPAQPAPHRRNRALHRRVRSDDAGMGSPVDRSPIA